MAGIVSGNNLGLLDSSMAQLGQRGLIGTAGNGKTGEGAYVNVASGNLVLQSQDDYLASRGLDLAMTRTYNAQGKFNDDNRDNWKSGLVRQVANLTGTLNAVGSTLTRIDGDGSETVYTCGADKVYRTLQGAGAADTLRFVSSTTQPQWIWTDGDTGAKEVYDWTMSGRLTSESDRSGMTNNYFYNAGGLLSQITSSVGDSTYFDYVGSNLAQIRTVIPGATSETRISSTRVHYEYDTSNRLSAVIVDLTPDDNAIADANTYWTRYTYDDASNRVATITQKDGTRLAFTYEFTGYDWRIKTLTDAQGATLSMTYDLAARTTSVVDALGYQTIYTYDGKGQLTGIQGPAINGISQKTAYEYDTSGNVTRIIDGAGNATEMTYDSAGHMVQQKDAEGNTTIRRYHSTTLLLLTESVYLTPASGSGAGTSVQAAEPAVTRYAYDIFNKLRFRVSADGRVTEYKYEGEQIASVIEYTGGLHPTVLKAGTSATAFMESDVTQWINAPGFDKTLCKRTNYSYDVRGLLKAMTTYESIDKYGLGIANGTESRVDYVYDRAGRLLKTIDASGETSYVYDGLGRLLSTSNPARKLTLYRYDDANNRSVVTMANGLATTSVFDNAGQLVSLIQADPKAAPLGETRYAYDAGGRLRMTTSPTGQRAYVLYDAAGRKQADIDTRGILTETIYDLAGRIARTVIYKLPVNVQRLTDAAGNPANIALSDIRPARHAEDRAAWSSYDNAGRLAKTVDALGYVKQFFYDGASRLVKTIQYDAPIAVAALKDVLKPSEILPSGSGRVEQFVYDKDNHLTGKVDAAGQVTSYHYDPAGQLLEKVSYAKPVQAGYVLSPAGVANLRQNAGTLDIIETNIYNRKGQLVGTVDGEQYLTEFIYTRGGNLKEKIRYSAPAKLADKIKPEAQRWSYEYTSLNQLAKETGPDGTVTVYQYDDVGNLTSTTRALSTDEARTIHKKFDVQGRLIAELSAQGADLLLSAATQEAIDAVWQKYGVRHAYDAAGRRISSTDQYQNRTLFFYDVVGNMAYTVNALGEVEATSFNEFNQLRERVRFARRIGDKDLAGLTGGALTGTILALFNALKDDRLDMRESFYYDRKGQLIDQVDAEKFHIKLNYDASGQITERTKQIDAAGRTETYAYRYDGVGRLLDTAEDKTFAKTFESKRYDAFGRLTASIDANGNTRTFSYDRRGRQVSSSDGLTAAVKTAYDAFDRILTQTDAQGFTTSYAYDVQRRLTTVITAEGIKTTIASNRHGQQISITDGNGVTTLYDYDRNGNLKSTTDGERRVSASEYGRAGERIASVDFDSTRTLYHYDAVGRMLSKTVDPDGEKLTTTYAYDTNGQAVRTTDPRGLVTLTAYDRKGQVLSVTLDPDGLKQTTRYSYDGRGKTLQVTDAGNVVTRYEYDKYGRRIRETIDPGRLYLQTSYEYDANGNVIARTDAGKNITRYIYDANNRLVYQIDAAGAVSYSKYDENGRLARTVAYARAINLSGLGLSLKEGEIAGRIIRDASDQALSYNYDKDGRLVRTTDDNGASTIYAYDGNNNLIEKRRRLLLPTTEITSDADSPQVRMVYDRANRLRFTATAQRADANLTQWAVVEHRYDLGPRVALNVAHACLISSSALPSAPTRADIAAWIAAVPQDGQRDASTCRIFDGAGRIAFEVDPTGAVSEFDYDGLGLPTLRIDYAQRLSRPEIYRNAVAISAVLKRDDPENHITRIIRDAAGRDVYEIDALGNVTEKKFDANGKAIRIIRHSRPLSITALGAQADITKVASLIAAANAGAEARIEHRVFDAADRQVYRVDADGFVDKTDYDALGRVIRTVRYAGAVTLNLAADQNVTQDILSKLLASQDASNSRVNTFSYDAQGNLKQSTDPMGGTERFTYDALGRKLSFTNKLNAVWEYRYDSAGHVLLERNPAVIVTAAAPGTVAANEAVSIENRFEYDAFGNLTARIEAAGRPNQRITRFQYDAAGRQIATILPPVGVYKADADRLLENGANGDADRVEESVQLISTVGYDAFGNAVSSTDVGGNRSYRIYDRAGRLLVEIDAAGYATAYDRDAFGNVKTMTRYATPLDPATLADNPNADSIAARLAALDHSRDRMITMKYDAAGHKLAVIEPLVESYFEYTDANSVKQSGYAEQSKVTATRFNAFGEVVEQEAHGEDRNGNPVKLGKGEHAYFYYNKRGQNTARIDVVATAGSGDALVEGAYLTTKDYDAVGNLVRETEYATVLNDGRSDSSSGDAWTETAFSTPGPNAKDRTTEFAYDLNNRRTVERRRNVEYGTAPDGSASIGDAITTYGYDALGNLTQVIDALGNASFKYYDALGRLSAEVSPSAQIRSRIAQLYVLLFNRGPESGGLKYWMDRIYAGESIEAVANAMFQSGVEQNCFAPTIAVKDLAAQTYSMATGRAFVMSDDEWRNNWAGKPTGKVLLQLARYIDEYSGGDVSRLDAQRNFNVKVAAGLAYATEQNGADPAAAAAAAENALLLDSLRIRIAQLYIVLTGRAPEADSLNAWVAQLRTNVALGQVAEMIYRSEPLRALYPAGMDNARLLARFYRNALGTDPDAAGGAWQARLMREPVGAVIADFALYYDTTNTEASRNYRERVRAAVPAPLTSSLTTAPVTVYRRDAYGNVVQRIEYARGAASANRTGFSLVGTDDKDRVTLTAYDLHGHAIQTFDAEGHLAYSSYDSFGHVAKQWQTVTIDGQKQTAFQVMRYDALGRIKEVQDEVATDVRTGAAPSSSTAPSSARPRLTARPVPEPGSAFVEMTWPSIGPRRGTIWAEVTYIPPGASPIDRPPTERHIVELPDGDTGAIIKLQGSDAAGGYANEIRGLRILLATEESEIVLYENTAEELAKNAAPPAPSAPPPVQFDRRLVSQITEYNAFGEITRRLADGESIESNVYDNAGRLSGTVAANGVATTMQYDIEGNATARVEGGLRTETRYDLMGHAIEQTLPRQEMQRGDTVSAVRPIYLDMAILGRSAYAPSTVSSMNGRQTQTNTVMTWQGTNAVELKWTSLADWGSSEFWVELNYTAKAADGSAQPGANLTISQKLSADEAKAGATITWSDQPAIERINLVRIYKKSADGDWVKVLERPQSGLAGQFLTIPAPDAADTAVIFQYRKAGQQNWTEYTQLSRFGEVYLFNASSSSQSDGKTAVFPDGSYEYQVIYDFHGKRSVHDNGTLAIGQVALRTQVAQLFVLLFNRAPVRSELDYWISQMEAGKSLEYVAEALYASDVARAVYPADIDNAGLIEKIFRNALGREIDAETAGRWNEQMQALQSKGRFFGKLLQSVVLNEGGSPVERNSHLLFMNKAAIAQAYAADMAGTDVAVAADIISRVTADNTLNALRAARNSAGVPTADYRTRVTQLFVLLFNRAPTHSELERWTREITDGKKSYDAVAQAIFNEGAALAGYPANIGTAALFDRIYKNALGRIDSTMDSGATDWAKVLESEERNWQTSAAQSASSPNLSKGIVFNRLIAALVGYSDTGNPVGQASYRLFQNKVRAALYYAAALKGNDADAGKAIMQLVSPNDAVGILRAAEDATPASLPRLQIARLYILLFNRAPDEQGLDYWTAELYKGESMSRIIDRMLSSDAMAARQDGALIGDIYKNALGREPDAAELAYWRGRMSAGSRGAALAGMLNNVLFYDGTDPGGLASQRLFNLKAAVGLTYAELGGLDLAGAQAVIDAAAADMAAEAAVRNAAQAAAIRDAAMAMEVQARANAAATAAAATAAAVESTAIAAAIAGVEADAALKKLAQANLEVEQAKAKYEEATRLVKKASDDVAAAELLANQTAAAAKTAAANAAADKSAEAASAALKAKTAADAADAALATARLNKDAAAKKAADAAALCGSALANASSAQTALTNANNALAAAKTNAAAAVTANTQAQAALKSANADYASASTAVASLAQQAQQRTMVYQLYVLLFNRQNPDTEGVNYWVGKLLGGSSFAALAQSMYVSGGLSVLSDASVVHAIYMGALGRTVTDSGGEAYWTSELANAGKPGYRSTKGDVFVNLIAGISGYTGSDPVGIASKQSFNTKVSNGLAAAAKVANDAMNAAAEKARSAATTASTATSEVNRTAAVAANAATAKTNAESFVSAVSSASSQDLAWRVADAAATTAAASLAKAQSDASAADANTAKTKVDAAAVATLAASTVAVQRTQVMQLVVLLFNNTRPDAGSFNGWVSQLAAGKTLGQLAQIMYESDSARAIYPTGMLDADIIRTIYKNALGRVAADAEVNYWNGQFLTSGRYPAIVQLLNNVWNYYGSDSAGLTSARLYSEKVSAGLSALADGEAAKAATARTAYQAAQSAEAQARQAYLAATDKAKAYSDTASAGLNAKIAVPATSNQLLMAQMYVLLYNRAPEASGLAYWCGALAKGVTPEAIALSMIAADPVLAKTSAAEFVTSMYNNALGRAPDAEGLAYWTGELAKGKSKAAVALSIIAGVAGYAGADVTALKSRQLFNNKVAVGLSYGAVLGGTDISQAKAILTLVTATDATAAMTAAVAAVPVAYQRTQITKLYLLLFNKTPDLDGMNYWVGELGSGKSVAELAQAMVNTEPARAVYPIGITNEQIVTKLYANAFNRTPEADGLKYWKDRLDADALEFNNSNLVGQTRPDAKAFPKGRVLAAFLSAIDQAPIDNSLASSSRKTFEGKVADALRNALVAAQAAIDPASQKSTSMADAALKATAAAKFAMEVAIAARAQGSAAIAAIRTVDFLPEYLAGAATRQYVDMNGKLEILPDAGIRRISQEVDRWGNVLSTTDARNSAWVTRYSYNAFNQRIESNQPGTETAAGPTINRFWYDRLGRQIAAMDANGNINGRRYDAAGNVTEELQADGGIVQYRLDAFGQRIVTRTANGLVSTAEYDRLGHLIATSTGKVDVHDVVGNTPSLAVVRRAVQESIVNRYGYDELGRRVSVMDASGAATRTVYDFRGNVIASIDALDRRTLSEYDGQNRKIKEGDNNGFSQKWIYENGRLHYYFNRGAQQISYAYNDRAQVTFQTSSIGQSIYYKYDAAGYLSEIDDQGTGTKSTYVVDADGRRVRERTIKTGSNGEVLVLQDNQLAYDALGRLTQVMDGRYRVDYGYDHNGNRIWVHTFYRTDASNTAKGMAVWNTYDAMNRQIIVDGRKDEATGKIDIDQTTGHRISYDNAGNRIADAYYGKKIQVNATQVMVQDLKFGGPEGGIEYVDRLIYKYDYKAEAGLVNEVYLYDGAARLTDVMRDGLHAEKRRYDAAGRMVQSGLGGLDGLPIADPSIGNMKGAFNEAGIAIDARISRYDAAGQLIAQRISHPVDGEIYLDYQYDGVGNLLKYVSSQAKGRTATYEYKYDLARLGDYQLAGIVGNQGGPDGRTENTYDVNGHLVSVKDAIQPKNARTLINDTAGHVLLKIASDGAKTFTLLANGEVLGSSSESAENFHTGFERVDAAAYMTGATAYTVQKNEDLKSIARAVWGDANLWYYIAEANGIDKVEAGQVIMVPPRPNTVHNDKDTFRPYSASKAVGDLTPELPLPPPKKSSNFFKKVFVAAMGAIASYFTYGVALEFFAGLGSYGSAVAAAATAGAANTIAGQAAGNVVGTQAGFNWSAVALSAISAAAGQALGVNAPAGGKLGEVAVHEVLGNAMNQGLAIALGMQRSFNWSAVAAAAVATPVSVYVGDALGTAADNSSGAFARFSQQFVGQAAGQVVAHGVGGNIGGVGDVLGDVFGNALGNSIAENLQPTPAAKRGQLGNGTYKLDAEVNDLLSPMTGVSVQPQTPASQFGSLGNGAYDGGSEINDLLMPMLASPSVLNSRTDDHALDMERIHGQAMTEAALRGTLGQGPAKEIILREVAPSLIDASLSMIGEEPGSKGVVWNTGAVSYEVDLSYPQMRQIPVNELGPFIVAGSLRWPVGSEGWKLQQESAQALQQPMFAPDDLIGAPIKLGVKGIAANAVAMFGTMKNIGSKEISVLLREGGGGLNKTVISFEDNLVLRGDTSRAQIVQEIGNSAQPSIKSILELDPNARIGFRGSLADGLKNPAKLGPNGERVAFDGVVATKGGAPYIGRQGYDADFFVMSDSLAAQLGDKPFFRNAARLDSSLNNVFNDFGQTLRNNPILNGMKPEPPTFRVFTQDEMKKKLSTGDAQIYFLTGGKR